MEFAEIPEKMTLYVTKLINAQINLCVQTAEKDTWQEVMTELKKRVNKKCMLIAEWEDEELFKS